MEIEENLRMEEINEEKVRGERNVDIEKGKKNKEVGGLGGEIIGKFGKKMSGNEKGKKEIEEKENKVGNGEKRKIERLVGKLKG